MRKIVICCIVILCSCCPNNKEQLVNNIWLYQTGYYLGDLISFDNSKGKGKYQVDDKLNIYKNDTLIGKATCVNSSEIEILSPYNNPGCYKHFKTIE